MPTSRCTPAAASTRYTASTPFCTEALHIDVIVLPRPVVVPLAEPPVAGNGCGSAQVAARGGASRIGASFGPSVAASLRASTHTACSHVRPDGQTPSLHA